MIEELRGLPLAVLCRLGYEAARSKACKPAAEGTEGNR